MTWQNRPKTVEDIETDVEHFRKSMNEWVLFLSQQYKELAERMASIERRMAKTEMDSHFKL